MTRRTDFIHSEFAAKLDRNERPTYVYTYPFKGAYRPIAETRLVRESWASTSGRINVYVHIPYCDMKCSFCALFTTTTHTPSKLADYCQSLLKEIRIVARLVNWDRCQVDSLYFGGGTPSLLSPDQLSEICGELNKYFNFRADAELAIEAAPNTTDKLGLRNLVEAGFQRLSIGVQSFDSQELLTMGRTYDAKLGLSMTSEAIEAGFRNVNVDLIYGLPGQSVETWLQNLGTAVGLGVKTITIYPLTIRSRTQFGRQHTKSSPSFPGGAEIYDLYDTAFDFLSSHGYLQYSAAGFAKDTGGNRHEINEFSGIPTLGLGVAALSYSPSIHYTSGNYLEGGTGRVITEYMATIDAGDFPIRSGIALDDDEVRRRYLILGFLFSGIDRDEYQTMFHDAVEVHFDSEIDVLRREQCVEEIGNKITLSERGRRFSSLVANLFASAKVKQLAESYR